MLTSELTWDESSRGDPVVVERRKLFLQQCEIIPETEAARVLGRQLIENKAVPATEPEDALHIALATTSEIDYIASWNFSHLVGAEPKRKLEKVISQLGFRPPYLETPESIYESLKS